MPADMMRFYQVPDKAGIQFISVRLFKTYYIKVDTSFRKLDKVGENLGLSQRVCEPIVGKV
jgi:hypothetical protein